MQLNKKHLPLSQNRLGYAHNFAKTIKTTKIKRNPNAK